MVEDGLVDARLAIGALQHGGFRHRLTLVRDGEEALEFILQQGRFAQAPRPDLILLDLMLPKRSGLEVLNEVKSRDVLREIPVVVMTASQTEEDKLQCAVAQSRRLHRQAGQHGEVSGAGQGFEAVLAG